MPDHTYKVIDIVGSSHTGIEEAINGALASAAATEEHLDWFVVKEVRGQVQAGKALWYQVTLQVGARLPEAPKGRKR